jgi:hypothetical protein
MIVPVMYADEFFHDFVTQKISLRYQRIGITFISEKSDLKLLTKGNEVVFRDIQERSADLCGWEEGMGL